MEALRLQQRTTPEELLHLTTAERERIRTIPSLHIPCEQTIIACKKLLATSCATETGTFANGAYVTDPVRFVSVLCVQSPLLVVGGDTGDQLTKVGVTYLDEEKTQQFAALLVYKGKDDYTDLDTLNEVDAATRATHSILSRWLQSLHDHLLHKGEWEAKEIEEWRAAVDDILLHWCAETG